MHPDKRGSPPFLEGEVITSPRTGMSIIGSVNVAKELGAFNVEQTAVEDGVFESFSTSMPLVCGYYWYWSPWVKDFIVVEAVLRKGKMKLKIGNSVQAELDEGGFIHSKIKKPTLPGAGERSSSKAQTAEFCAKRVK